jgi:hypothetical protein
MLTRRDLLQASAAISVVPAVLATRWAGASVSQSSVASFHTVLFDARFAEARQFGAEAARLRMNVRGFDGDITNVWFRELSPVWRSKPVATADMAVAGLTHYGALFCLERLAWDAGMRVIYRAEHALGSPAPRVASLGVAGASVIAPLGPHASPNTLLSWIIAPKSQALA